MDIEKERKMFIKSLLKNDNFKCEKILRDASDLLWKVQIHPECLEKDPSLRMKLNNLHERIKMYNCYELGKRKY